MKAAEEEEDVEEGKEKPEKPEEPKAEFPIEEFNLEFETNNQVVEIPEEVADDIDNDYDLPYTPPAMGEWGAPQWTSESVQHC